MPLFNSRPSATERFTPKTVKFSKLYRFNTEGGKFGGSLILQAGEALKKSGFTDDQIRDIIYKDKPVSVSDIKRIAGIMNRERIYGFEKDPDYAVKKYLNKERVKAQSIAGIRKEHILEAGTEDLANYGVTSLNKQGVSPNAPKPGESSILARKRSSQTVRSLSGKSGSSPISSLRGRQTAGSLSPLNRGNKPSGGSVSFQPKF